MPLPVTAVVTTPHVVVYRVPTGCSHTTRWITQFGYIPLPALPLRLFTRFTTFTLLRVYYGCTRLLPPAGYHHLTRIALPHGCTVTHTPTPFGSPHRAIAFYTLQVALPLLRRTHVAVHLPVTLVVAAARCYHTILRSYTAFLRWFFTVRGYVAVGCRIRFCGLPPTVLRSFTGWILLPAVHVWFLPPVVTYTCGSAVLGSFCCLPFPPVYICARTFPFTLLHTFCGSGYGYARSFAYRLCGWVTFCIPLHRTVTRTFGYARFCTVTHGYRLHRYGTTLVLDYRGSRSLVTFFAGCRITTTYAAFYLPAAIFCRLPLHAVAAHAVLCWLPARSGSGYNHPWFPHAAFRFGYFMVYARAHVLWLFFATPFPRTRLRGSLVTAVLACHTAVAAFYLCCGCTQLVHTLPLRTCVYACCPYRAFAGSPLLPAFYRSVTLVTRTLPLRLLPLPLHLCQRLPRGLVAAVTLRAHSLYVRRLRFCRVGLHAGYTAVVTLYLWIAGYGSDTVAWFYTLVLPRTRCTFTFSSGYATFAVGYHRTALPAVHTYRFTFGLLPRSAGWLLVAVYLRSSAIHVHRLLVMHCALRTPPVGCGCGCGSDSGFWFTACRHRLYLAAPFWFCRVAVCGWFDFARFACRLRTRLRLRAPFAFAVYRLVHFGYARLRVYTYFTFTFTLRFTALPLRTALHVHVLRLIYLLPLRSHVVTAVCGYRFRITPHLGYYVLVRGSVTAFTARSLVHATFWFAVAFAYAFWFLPVRGSPRSVRGWLLHGCHGSAVYVHHGSTPFTVRHGSHTAFGSFACVVHAHGLHGWFYTVHYALPVPTTVLATLQLVLRFLPQLHAQFVYTHPFARIADFTHTRYTHLRSVGYYRLHLHGWIHVTAVYAVTFCTTTRSRLHHRTTRLRLRGCTRFLPFVWLVVTVTHTRLRLRLRYGYVRVATLPLHAVTFAGYVRGCVRLLRSAVTVTRLPVLRLPRLRLGYWFTFCVHWFVHGYVWVRTPPLVHGYLHYCGYGYVCVHLPHIRSTFCCHLVGSLRLRTHYTRFTLHLTGYCGWFGSVAAVTHVHYVPGYRWLPTLPAFTARLHLVTTARLVTFSSRSTRLVTVVGYVYATVYVTYRLVRLVAVAFVYWVAHAAGWLRLVRSATAHVYAFAHTVTRLHARTRLPGCARCVYAVYATGSHPVYHRLFAVTSWLPAIHRCCVHVVATRLHGSRLFCVTGCGSRSVTRSHVLVYVLHAVTYLVAVCLHRTFFVYRTVGYYTLHHVYTVPFRSPYTCSSTHTFYTLHCDHYLVTVLVLPHALPAFFARLPDHARTADAVLPAGYTFILDRGTFGFPFWFWLLHVCGYAVRALPHGCWFGYGCTYIYHVTHGCGCGYTHYARLPRVLHGSWFFPDCRFTCGSQLQLVPLPFTVTFPAVTSSTRWLRFVYVYTRLRTRLYWFTHTALRLVATVCTLHTVWFARWFRLG